MQSLTESRGLWQYKMLWRNVICNQIAKINGIFMLSIVLQQQDVRRQPFGMSWAFLFPLFFLCCPFMNHTIWSYTQCYISSVFCVLHRKEPSYYGQITSCILELWNTYQLFFLTITASITQYKNNPISSQDLIPKSGYHIICPIKFSKS